MYMRGKGMSITTLSTTLLLHLKYKLCRFIYMRACNKLFSRNEGSLKIQIFCRQKNCFRFFFYGKIKGKIVHLQDIVWLSSFI